MMNVSTLTVLLVCIMLECAHSASFEREGISPISERSTLTKFSVVDNWNAVCEEVCRAGYSGLGCISTCNSTEATVGYNDHNSFRQICPILCQNQLGRGICECAPNAFNPDLLSARNSLCSATCSWRKSLNGCTKCVDSATTVDGDGTTNANDENSSTTEEYVTDEENATTENHSTSDSNEDGSTTDSNGDGSTTDSNEDDTTTDETTTTTTTTTTTQATTTTTKSTTQATTTTPNWESMCEALCRNGEGGSLCNCDIPPFF